MAEYMYRLIAEYSNNLRDYCVYTKVSTFQGHSNSEYEYELKIQYSRSTKHSPF
jgi:hypothetical protein